MQSRLTSLKSVSKISHSRRAYGESKEGPMLGYPYTWHFQNEKPQRLILARNLGRVLSGKLCLCHQTGCDQWQTGVRRMLTIRDREISTVLPLICGLSSFTHSDNLLSTNHIHTRLRARNQRKMPQPYPQQLICPFICVINFSLISCSVFQILY